MSLLVHADDISRFVADVRERLPEEEKNVSYRKEMYARVNRSEPYHGQLGLESYPENKHNLVMEMRQLLMVLLPKSRPCASRNTHTHRRKHAHSLVQMYAPATCAPRLIL